MSAFENFIQLELPLRPYVATDPSQESIAIRRGAGPRQLTFVELSDGQVLGKVAGVTQGVSINDLGAKGFLQTFSSAAQTWTITHNRASLDCVVQVYEQVGSDWINVQPDVIKMPDNNTIVITFGAAQAGRAHVMFFNV
jgi:hypothetical protein